MDKKRSKGVTLFASLYLTAALFSLLESVALIALQIIEWQLSYRNNPSAGMSIAPLFFLIFAVLWFAIALLGITASIFLASVACGLFRLSDKSRKIAIVINYLAIIAALWTLFDWVVVYDAGCPSVLQKMQATLQLIFFVCATYYFTRPDVKEQFK